MPAERKSLCRVEIDGSQFHLLTTLYDEGEEGFHLALCDGEKAWTGSVLDGDLEIISKKGKMSFTELLNQTKKALTRENMGSFNFQYQVKHLGGDILQFTWKKHIAPDDIKFQLGSAKLNLQPSPVSVVKEIFGHIINSTQNFQERITALQSDNERLASERTSALKRLEKSVKSKELLEDDLYDKFVVVLNDKKQKIRELRDEIEELRANGVPSVSGVQSQTQSKVAESGDEITTPKKNSRRGQNDSEYDTEEEQQVTPSPSKKIKVTQAAANLSQDSSLMLDDGTVDDSPAAPKRRKRGTTTTKKTPAKPIIPKVPSSEGRNRASTSTARSSRSSVGRGASNVSKSSDSMDPEKLLADLDDF